MSAPVIIHNATVVTADGAGTIHYDAALVIHERRIAAIGLTGELLARYRLPRARVRAVNA